MSRDDFQDDAPDYTELRDECGTVKLGRKCQKCGKTMPSGTKFRKTVGIIDGIFFSEVRCELLGPEYDCPLASHPCTAGGAS